MLRIGNGKMHRRSSRRRLGFSKELWADTTCKQSQAIYCTVWRCAARGILLHRSILHNIGTNKDLPGNSFSVRLQSEHKSCHRLKSGIDSCTKDIIKAFRLRVLPIAINLLLRAQSLLSVCYAADVLSLASEMPADLVHDIKLATLSLGLTSQAIIPAELVRQLINESKRLIHKVTKHCCEGTTLHHLIFYAGLRSLPRGDCGERSDDDSACVHSRRR